MQIIGNVRDHSVQPNGTSMAIVDAVWSGATASAISSNGTSNGIASRYRAVAAQPATKRTRRMSAVDIFVVTNSVPTTGSRNSPFKHGRSWQYHPRSDRHSKTACWAILFDFFQRCHHLRAHALIGKIGIGINHEVLNVATGKSKNLDFVIQRIEPTEPPRGRKKGAKFFAGLVTELGIVLSPEEQQVLVGLPPVVLLDEPNAPLLVALEAKACMTEHIKSKPRLFDELNSSHALVHGSSLGAISAGWAVINTSSTFISPLRNDFPVGALPPTVNAHKPDSAVKLAEHLATLPVVSTANSAGFDVFGISMVSCANDESAMVKDTTTAVPRGLGYAQFLSKLDQIYSTRFANI